MDCQARRRRPGCPAVGGKTRIPRAGCRPDGDGAWGRTHGVHAKRGPRPGQAATRIARIAQTLSQNFSTAPKYTSRCQMFARLARQRGEECELFWEGKLWGAWRGASWRGAMRRRGAEWSGKYLRGNLLAWATAHISQGSAVSLRFPAVPAQHESTLNCLNTARDGLGDVRVRVRWSLIEFV